MIFEIFRPEAPRLVGKYYSRTALQTIMTETKGELKDYGSILGIFHLW
jgi:hypothetical protein